MDGVTSNDYNRVVTPAPYTFPSGESGLLFQSADDLQVYQRNQRLAQSQAEGFQTTLESFDSPVAISIQDKRTESSLITYDAQGNARNIGDQRSSIFLDQHSATYEYTSVTESLSRLLNLQITTAEGDRVSISSSLSNYASQSALDGSPNLALPKIFSTGSGAGGGSSVSIIGDLNDDEQAQIGQILDATMQVASLTERYARGEAVGDDLKGAIAGLKNLRTNLSEITTFGGTVEVRQSESVEHKVLTVASASANGRTFKGESDPTEEAEEQGENRIGLKDFLTLVLEQFDNSARELLASDPQREQKRGILEKLRDHNKESFTAAYQANTALVSGMLLATA